MNEVSKITDKETYRNQWNHIKSCLLLWERCSNTGSDNTGHQKDACLIVWVIAGMKKSDSVITQYW